MNNILCPFCEETGFDLIGLKCHIAWGWCPVYENTPLPSDEELERAANEASGK